MQTRHAHQREIDFLARECNAPIQEVTRLYDAEWGVLAADARLPDFLGVLTMRNVRKTLRQRGYPALTIT